MNQGCIKASRTERTKFKISIQGDDTADSKTIMIGTDTVGITVPQTKKSSCGTSNSGSIGINSNGELVISNTLLTFSFSSFKSGFEIESIATLDDSGSSTAIVQVTDGEEWELV